MDPFDFNLLSVTGRGIDLDYCDIEWFALETNRDHSVIFETASKYYILDSFVDHEKTLHMDITRWSTPKSDCLYSLQPKMEKLYTVNKNKTGS